MKIILIAFFLLNLSLVNGHVLDSFSNLYKSLNIDTSRDENGKFKMSSIITADSTLSMAKVYEIAKEIVYRTYGSGDAVIQYSSKEEGRARALITDISYKKGAMINMHDGADFMDEFPSTWGTWAKSQSLKEWKKMKAQALPELLTIIRKLKIGLQKQNSDNNF